MVSVTLPGTPEVLDLRAYLAIEDDIKALGSSEQAPLTDFLDDEPRGP